MRLLVEGKLLALGWLRWVVVISNRGIVVEEGSVDLLLLVGLWLIEAKCLIYIAVLNIIICI